jgi:hypothetical protein
MWMWDNVACIALMGCLCSLPCAETNAILTFLYMDLGGIASLDSILDPDHCAILGSG